MLGKVLLLKTHACPAISVSSSGGIINTRAGAGTWILTLRVVGVF